MFIIILLPVLFPFRSRKIKLKDWKEGVSTVLTPFVAVKNLWSTETTCERIQQGIRERRGGLQKDWT